MQRVHAEDGARWQVPESVTTPERSQGPGADSRESSERTEVGGVAAGFSKVMHALAAVSATIANTATSPRPRLRSAYSDTSCPSEIAAHNAALGARDESRRSGTSFDTSFHSAAEVRPAAANARPGCAQQGARAQDKAPFLPPNQYVKEEMGGHQATEYGAPHVLVSVRALPARRGAREPDIHSIEDVSFSWQRRSLPELRIGARLLGDRSLMQIASERMEEQVWFMPTIKPV